MGFDRDFEHREFEVACEREAHRLLVAEKWAGVNSSNTAREFERGRADRVAGEPCRSANGAYLDGWYSISNPKQK